MIGAPLEPRQVDAGELPPPLAALFGWLTDVGHDADVAALRNTYPEVGWKRYSEWLESQRARFGELCPVGVH